MNSLTTLIILTVLISNSCGRNVHVQQEGDVATGKHTRSRLDLQIPAPDPVKYRDIRDGKDWQNPFLVVTRDGVSLMAKAVSLNEWKEVPLDRLADSLIALPLQAWPYGRVIGVMESGIRNLNDDQPIERNKAQTEKILKSLGITIDWWPSA